MSDLTTEASVHFPRVLDATMLSDWRKCPHAFFRRHCQGLTRPRTNVHLHFGGVVAVATEVARKSYFYPDGHEFSAGHENLRGVKFAATGGDAALAVHTACEAAIQAWGDFDPPASPTRSEANKTLASCLAAIIAYFKEWPLDDDLISIHVHDDAPCIEWSGAAPIPGSSHPETGEPLLYAGRFDMIGDYQRSAWGLDDKTTSVDPNSDSWRNQWRLRSQFTGYTWLAAQYGVKLDGFIIRGVGVLQASVRLGWCLTPRPSWMVARWLKQVQDDSERMCNQFTTMRVCEEIGAEQRGAPFPRVLDSACADFGGCTYLDLCSAEHPEDWTSNYEVAFWDPLRREAE